MEIKDHGKVVFSFSGSSVVGEKEELLKTFPGNKADRQFAAEEAKVDQLLYSCAYTGKHDHGDLPPQKRGAPHEETLLFLQEARRSCAEYLNT